MLSIRESQHWQPNARILEASRATLKKDRSTNLDWLKDRLSQPPFDRAPFAIVLIGGRSSMDLGLRFGQALARYDRTPSSWSEVGLLVPDKQSFSIYGINLCNLHRPRGKHLLRNVPTWQNGVQDDVAKGIDDPELFPNIGLIGIDDAQLEEMSRRSSRSSITAAMVRAVIDRYAKGQDVISSAECAWAWLGYAWGIRDQHNPLHRGVGIPSAMFVEAVMSQLGLDLTPGLASHSSCPEAIWQTFKWWHQNVTEPAPQGAAANTSRFFGFVRRRHVIDEP